LPSDEAAVEIDRFMHETVNGSLLITNHTGRKETQKSGGFYIVQRT